MTDENITIPGKWDIDYDYSAGETASHFLATLRDEGRLLGAHCPECERVLAPPRGFCERCFVDTDEWVDIGSGGQIEAYTVVPHDVGAGPDAPFALAYVQLDGAHTAMVNILKGINLSDPDAVAESLSIGDRVSVSVAPPDDREGRITDFHYELEE